MARKTSIDLGLEVIETVRQPGQTMREVDVARICDCSPQLIRQITNRAMAKMRRRAAELRARQESEVAR